MASVPGFARPSPAAGHGRNGQLGQHFLDLVDEAHLTFHGKSDGEIAFGALKGFLGARYGATDGATIAEFSWKGTMRMIPTAVADGL